MSRWDNGSAAIYHCPADKSTVLDRGQKLRNSSYPMSGYMNDDSGLANGFSFKRFTDIIDPSPVKAFVSIHEHASTIEDA